MFKAIIAALALALLCGCFKIKDELVLEADGSGVVRLETVSTVPPEMMAGFGMGAREDEGGPLIYPPATESEAKKFFPEKDFAVVAKQKRGADGSIVLTVEAKFKDVNALLASPYARTHALSIENTNGSLRVRALSGLEAAARFADVKADSEMFGAMRNDPEMEKKKGEMRVEFRVVLPSTVSGGTGVRADKAITWIADRKQITNATEFIEKVSAVWEASCSADKVSFKPVTPVRLALQPFAELRDRAMATTTTAIDAKKIVEAAKFVPQSLRVTRSLDLTGEGGNAENGAELIGAILIPRGLAPQRWGEPKLDEVVDPKGKSLKLAATDRYSIRNFNRRDALDADEKEDAKTSAATETRHAVTLNFAPPDWKVKEIARIKGSVPLHYAGGATEVVKLAAVVPAKAIMDMTKSQSFSFEDTERAIDDPALARIGLKVKLQSAMVQGSMTSVTLGLEGEKANIDEAQVFDANGKPWPSFLQPTQSGGDEGRTINIMVAGQPKGPLSLALIASGGGQVVEVPISLEKVPVRGN